MDEQTVTKEVSGWFGHILTLLSTSIIVAFGYGKQQQKIKAHSDKLEDIDERLNTRRGGVLTNESFDRRQSDCRDKHSIEIGYVKENQDRLEQRLCSVDDKLDDVKNMIAKLVKD